jgi:hypothetical protein
MSRSISCVTYNHRHENEAIITLVIVLVIASAGVGSLVGSSGQRTTTLVSTTTLLHTHCTAAGRSACGSYTSTVVGGPQIALSCAYTGNSVCLDFNFTNIGGEAVYPTAGTITVVNGTGNTLSTQTLVSAGHQSGVSHRENRGKEPLTGARRRPLLQETRCPSPLGSSTNRT